MNLRAFQKFVFDKNLSKWCWYNDNENIIVAFLNLEFLFPDLRHPWLVSEKIVDVLVKEIHDGMSGYFAIAGFASWGLKNELTPFDFASDIVERHRQR